MIERYIELESRLLGQEARAVARTLIAIQVIGAPLLFIFGNGDTDVVRGVVMLLGAAAIVAGVRLLRRSPTLGKLTIGAGGAGTIVFIGAIAPFLGAVALIVYVIVLLISLVA
jgi:hypothetical protein